jgi:hypothetical protein
MTQNKIVQPVTGRHQEERNELMSNHNGKIVGGKKGLEYFCLSICVKRNNAKIKRRRKGGGEKQPPDFGQTELWQTRQTCLTGSIS